MKANNQNPVLIFSAIMQQVGALSLLAGIYKLAFPAKKPKNSTQPMPNGKTPSQYFLTAFGLFMGANKINQLFVTPNTSAAAKPKIS